MAKDRLEVGSQDSFAFDDDLDFMNEVDPGFNQSSKKPSTPIGNVLKGMKSAVVDSAKSPSFYRETLSKILPRTFGEVMRGVDDASTGVYQIYDESVREVKPGLNRLSKKLDQLIPENSKILKKITEKMVDATGGRDMRYSTAENSDEQAVTSALSAIFDQSNHNERVRSARDMMRDRIGMKQYARTTSILEAISRNTSIQAQYTTNITDKYHRKSLELQIRSYMTQRSMLSAMVTWQNTSKAQLEAIVRNTALPEYAKITASNRFMERMKSEITGSLFGNGTMIQKGVERLKTSARGFVSGLSQGIDMADFGMDAVISGKEQMESMNEMYKSMGIEPFTKEEMAGAAAAGYAVDYVRDLVAARVKKHTDKMQGLKDVFAKGARMMLNPGASIDELRRSDKWQKKLDDPNGLMAGGYRALDFLMSHFQDDGLKRTFKNGVSIGDMDQPAMGFDNKAHISLVDVIPGYLSSIHREIAMLRTGGKVDAQVYDYERRTFVKSKVLSKQIIQSLEKEAKQGLHNYYAGSLAKEVGGENSSEDTKTELHRFFVRIAQLPDFRPTFENIKKTSAYQKLSPEAKFAVDQKMLGMENGQNAQEDAFHFEEKVSDIRKNIPSLDQKLASYVRAGYGKHLEKRGLLKKTEEGHYDVDEFEFSKFLESNGVIKSDMNAKEGIQPKSASDVLSSAKSKWSPRAAFEGIKKTALFDWFYKKGKGDRRKHSGPMAQDVRRNLGDDAAPDGKAIDLPTMNGATMAAVQHLGDRVDQLDGQDSIFHLIRSDTKTIVELLGGGSGTGGKSRISGDGYRDLILSATQNVLDLAHKLGSDTLSGASTILSKGNEKVAQPLLKFLQESYANNKDKAKDKLKALFDRAMDLGNSAMDFGQRMLKETIPSKLRSIKEYAKDLYKKASARLNAARDLYMPGGVMPIIQAVKLRMGMYRDAVTGEVIKTIDELMACKNDIVDELGNVVLTLEDKARGLYDARGEEVMSTLKNIGAAIIGGAIAIKDRAVSNFNKLVDSGPEALRNLTNKGKGMLGGFGKGFGFGGGKVLSDSYQVQVDIRDILLGYKRGVKKRLMKDGWKPPGIESSLGSGVAGVAAMLGGDSSGGSGEGASANLTSSYGGPGMLSRIKGFISSRTPEQKAKFEELKARASGKFSEWKESARSKYDALKNWKNGAGGPKVSWRDRLKAGGTSARGMFRSGFGFLKDASSLFGGNDQKTEQDRSDEATKAKDHAEGKANGMESKQKIATVAPKDRAFNDKDGDGRRDGGVEDQAEKNEALRKSREKKGATADLTFRYKNGGIGELLGGLGSILGFVSKGVTTLFGAATGLLSMLPGAGKLLGGAAKAGSAAVRAAGSVVGAAGKGILNIAKTGVGVYARGVLTAATTLIPMAGSAIVAVGSSILGGIASVLASPVVLGIGAAALAGYGIWKLYKYATRNHMNELEQIRLRQYGFAYSPEVKDYNHLVYGLEAYLQDGRTGFNNGQAYLFEKKINPADLLELFGISEKDTEKVNAFNTWLGQRFKPVYLTHQTALFAVNRKFKLDDAHKLTPAEKIKYLTASAFPDGPYDVTVSPAPGLPVLSAEREPIKKLTEALIADLQTKLKSKNDAGNLPNLAAAKTPEAPRDKVDPSVNNDKKPAPTDANANAKVNTAVPNASQGEDGGKTNNAVTTGASVGQSNLPGSMPMAPGGISNGEGGMNFVKLGTGVNIVGLVPGVYKNFMGMAEEYGKSTGKSIKVNDGLRSYAEQEALYRASPDKAAKPGFSLHEKGLAIDINSKDADELEKLGLMKKYGFTRPVGGEPWHVEPAGIQRNLKLAKENPETRDMMIAASLTHGGGGYGTESNSTKGKRNHELAMALLGVSSNPMSGYKDTGSTGDQSAPTGQAANSPSFQGPQLVSNRPKETEGGTPNNGLYEKPSTRSDQQKTMAFSKTESLPTPASVDRQKAAANDSVTTTSATSSSETNKSWDGPGAGPSSVEDLKALVASSARKVGVDPNTAQATVAVESDFNPNARAGTSSACGLYQCVNGTWDGLINKYGSKHGIKPGTPATDPKAASLLGAEYLKENERAIASVKPNPTATDLYLAHFLGAAGAKKFLSAIPDDVGASILPDAAAKNKSIFYTPNGQAKTIRQIYADLGNKLKSKSSKYGISPTVGTMTASPAQNAGSGIGEDKPTQSGGALPSPRDQASTGAAATSGGQASSPSTNKGVFLDTRSNINPNASSGRQESGSAPSSVKLSTIEGYLEKSLGVQTDSFAVLKDILENVKTEKVAEVLAAAVSAATQAASKKEESPKSKDDAAMGRSSQTTASSLDLKRKAA